MTDEELIAKADRMEGLTVEEVKRYQQLVKPVHHVYGKYGTLAKNYIEEHATWKLITLAGVLPEYLHGIDKAATRMREVMEEKLSKDERYKRTGNYLEDVRRITEMQHLIDEEILSELVYVD